MMGHVAWFGSRGVAGEAGGSVVGLASTPEWKKFMKTDVEGPKSAKVVYWTAAWCGPCKMISPEYAKLSEKYPDITFAKVDVDECQEAAQTASISSMPTFQFFKFGSFLGQFSGADVKQLEAYSSRTNDI